jgi:HEAT repeat protein
MTMKAWKTLAAVLVAILMSGTARAGWDAWGGEGGEKEKEKKERVSEREADLYEQGEDAIDDEEWESAVRYFAKCAELKGKRADGAMYWSAYALNRLGNKEGALQMIAALKKSYPQSEWIDDADALSVEIKERRGQQVKPSDVEDEDVKLMAIHALMNTDSERAIPLLEKILKGNSSKKIKEGAMFVLSQSSSPKAHDLIASFAKGNSSPALQKEAVHYLGIGGGERNRQLLLEVYNGTKSRGVKEEVLNALMVSGDRGRILNAAKTETDPDLREEAIRLLGVMGARNDLAAMWATESSPNAREAIIDAMFIAGDVEHIGEIAKNDKSIDVRGEAIRKLGLMGKKTAPALLSFYTNDPSPEIKEAVIDALFVQNNARALIDLSKKETNKSLKREILQKLSVMGNKEAVDYMLEILNED